MRTWIGHGRGMCHFELMHVFYPQSHLLFWTKTTRNLLTSRIAFEKKVTAV